eukprot:TRINITY_DN8901_c0_g1_i1.p1 TRINITY_DN8901_c0_g1~~TRINITY_DN8901_c0_g1_i1.p1  ORF type:complete len:157 (-),score=20.04 TRINITY_DN8901_c0_g1_i1:210-680(-)
MMIDPSADFHTHYGCLDKQMTELVGVQLTSLTALNLMISHGLKDPTLQKVQVAVFVQGTHNDVYITGAERDAMFLNIFVSDVHRNAALHELSGKAKSNWQVATMPFSSLVDNFATLPSGVIGFTLDRLPESYFHLAGKDYLAEKRDIILHFNKPRK